MKLSLYFNKEQIMLQSSKNLIDLITISIILEIGKHGVFTQNKIAY